MKLTDKLERVRDEAAYHMDQILGLFKPGAKITVVVRTPDHPDRDFIMTDDLIDEAIAALLRRKHDAGRAALSEAKDG